MIGVGLNLLVIAFEVGAYAIKCHTNMHSIIKDQLCRNILSVCHNPVIKMKSWILFK